MRVWLLVMVLLFTIHVDAQQPEEFIVDAFVSDDMPYVGQQIAYVFRYAALERVPGVFDEQPDFEGFWISVTYESLQGRVEVIDGEQYIVTEIVTEITPLEAGQLVIAPGVLDVPETVFREGRRIATEAVTVQVQPLPQGAPEAFNGAVGQFDAEIMVDNTSVTLGGPVMLTMSVTGTGNLELLPAPTVPEPDGWRVYRNPAQEVAGPLTGLRLEQKIFDWLLIPQRAGSQTFPPVVFSYFDPQTATYQTITSGPFAVEVFPGEGDLLERPGVRAPDANAELLTVKPAPARLGRVQGGMTPLQWVLWIVPPLVFAVSGLLVYGMRFQRIRAQQARRRRALRRAMQRLDVASRETTPAHAAARAIAAVYQYTADRANRPVHEVQRYDVEQLLSESSVTDSLREEIAAILSELDSVRYLPAGMRYDLRPVLNRLAAALKRWDGVS